MILNRLALLIFVLLLAMGCAQVPIGTDPFHDSYYDKEKLLMTEEELEIYTHLPDRETKEEFIKEFWLRRDPTTGTEKNELKEEFDRRVEYANRWFDEKGDGRSGWDTDRGRVFLVFGPPDRRDRGQVQMRTRPGTVNMETWSYDRHQLMIRFIDEMGYRVFRLTADSQYSLMIAQRTEKLRWGAREFEDAGFSFAASYKDGGINIIIPLKNLQVDHQGDDVVVTFNVSITVYLKFKKIDTFNKLQLFKHDQEEIHKLDNLSFSIPYPLAEKGRYHLDIVVENKLTSQKYRKLLKVRL